jgi:pseudouridine kinase
MGGLVEGVMTHREPYCVVIGGINIDVQGFSHKKFILGDSNPGTVKKAFGGVGRNIAENLTALGMRTELITIIGEGAEWQNLIRHTEAKGIGLQHCPRMEGISIPTYLCVLDNAGNLVGAVADMNALDNLRTEHLEEQIELLDCASAIVIDGNIPQSCIEWIVERYHDARPERPFLVADPVSATKAKKFTSCFGAFDLAKPNIAEAAAIAGVAADSALDEIILALEHGNKLPRELYMSLGEKGMAVFDGEKLEKVSLCTPELRPVSVNRSGSGDAACAALVWLCILERRSSRKGSGLQDSSSSRANEVLLFDRAEKAKLALVAALYAAASDQPVNPSLSIENLCQTSQVCYPELSSLVEKIRRGEENE